MNRVIHVQLADISSDGWPVDPAKLHIATRNVHRDKERVRPLIDDCISELSKTGAAPDQFWKNSFAITLLNAEDEPGKLLALEFGFGLRTDGSAYHLGIGLSGLTFGDLDRAVEAGLIEGNPKEFILHPAQRGAAGGGDLLAILLSDAGITLFSTALTEVSRQGIIGLYRKLGRMRAQRRVRRITAQWELNGITNQWYFEELISRWKRPTTKKIARAFKLPEPTTAEILVSSGRLVNEQTGLWSLSELPEAKQKRDEWQRTFMNAGKPTYGKLG